MDKWWIPALGHPQMDSTMFLFPFSFFTDSVYPSLIFQIMIFAFFHSPVS